MERLQHLREPFISLTLMPEIFAIELNQVGQGEARQNHISRAQVQHRRTVRGIAEPVDGQLAELIPEHAADKTAVAKQQSSM